MANGTYGTVRAANITANDVDIWYNYRPSRSETDENFVNFLSLNASEVLLSPIIDSTEQTYTSYGVNDLPGLYNLKLPLTQFSKPGIYTVYIRPKEVYATIQDVNVLSAYPNVQGIIVKISSVNAGSSFMNNGSLVGYRIEYFDSNNNRQDYYRIITSNNKVEPVNVNTVSGSQKSIRYIYNDASDLVFITVTPSTAPNTKPNAMPFIGQVGQKICFINTKFNPIMMEIEMVENDADTLALLVAGDQVRSLGNGLLTTYTKNHEIYKQVQLYQIKDSYTNSDLYQVRQDNGASIDTTQEWNSIIPS